MTIFTSYADVGVKEDVSDIISNISPTATPFLSAIGTEAVHNTLVQWMTDVLDSPSVNAQLEAFTASPENITPTVMLNNVTQILTKVIQISGTVDAVDAHGRAKESAYQISKMGRAIKRDLEYAMLNSQTLVNSGSTTARQFASFQAQIPSGGFIHTGGSTTAMSEANLLAALQYCYTNGSEPNTCLVTPTDALTVATFAQAAGRYRTIPSGDKEVTQAVTLYASSFGDIKVTISRNLQAGDSLIYHPEYWKLLVLRNWTREVLAKTGDSLMQMILGEYSLKCVNPAASAIVRRET